MTPFIKNILVVLGILTVGFAGYYFYSQRNLLGIQGEDGNEVVYTNMLANTEVFIARSQELNVMNLDLSVLDDPRFTSLKAFSRPIEDQPVGKTDPFSSISTE
jgi:hypothetical protein